MKALFGILFLLSGFATSAYADGSNANFGIVYGSSVADADNTTPYWMSGVKGSAYVYPSISVGGYYYYSDRSGEPSSAQKFKYSLHGVDAAYHLPSGPGEVFFSLRGGFSKVETITSGTQVTFSPYHLGFATGYDYLLMPWCSVGFEGSLLHLKKSNTSAGGVSYKHDDFNVINFLVTLQFRM